MKREREPVASPGASGSWGFRPYCFSFIVLCIFPTARWKPGRRRIWRLLALVFGGSGCVFVPMRRCGPRSCQLWHWRDWKGKVPRRTGSDGAPTSRRTFWEYAMLGLRLEVEAYGCECNWCLAGWRLEDDKDKVKASYPRLKYTSFWQWMYAPYMLNRAW